jgi:hypothetical protein
MNATITTKIARNSSKKTTARKVATPIIEHEESKLVAMNASINF